MAEKQMAEQEFYVGYLPQAPSGVARKVRRTVSFLLLVAVCVAAGFAAVQTTFAPSAFEYGKERTFEGTLESKPYPALLLRRPGVSPGQSSYSRYLLVAGGKHGADSQVEKFSGRHVRLHGSLIYRDGQTMIELVHGSISSLTEEAALVEQTENLGTMELTGEIVDSKCNFGVMNPGEGKVHKDCAVRCLSGGIPPAFVTKDLRGRPAVLLLIGPNQAPLKIEHFLPYVAQPVRVRGRVLSLDGTLMLEVEPSSVSPAL
jgi:hypothetical protein